MTRNKFQLESFWARRSWLLSVIIFVLVSVMGFALDFFLVVEGLPRVAMMIFSNAITGLIAGCLFYSFASHQRSRRALVRERMQTVAELNHHIRNALQVIKYWGGTQPNLGSMQLQLINESVERIEWALKEVLPRYPQPGEARPAESQPPGFSSKSVNDHIQQRKQTGPH